MVKVEAELKDPNIWNIHYRMYLTGDNTIRFPWRLPEDFPE
jgi:hypothetical protein